MPKRKITKKDPDEEISSWVNYQSRNNKPRQVQKASDSLTKLHQERRRALFTKLGGLVLCAVCGLMISGYYISPKANVKSVKVKGAAEIPRTELVRASGVTASDKVLGVLTRRSEISHKLAATFPEIKDSRISVYSTNQLQFTLKEKPIIAYIRTGNVCRMILKNGKVGSQKLPLSMIDKSKPLFVGYSKKVSLQKDLQILSALPESDQHDIKMLSGETERPTQIIFVMKDNNVIVGNVRTIQDKFKYYRLIKPYLHEDSLVDLELGGFSRPLTTAEKAKYGLSK